MTPFAKMLVFANVILSLLFTGWTLALYTQQVDWAPGVTLTGDKIDNRPGRLAQLKTEIADLVRERDMYERAWQQATPDIVAADDYRAKYQDWYADMLAATQTGKDRKGDKDIMPPVRKLERTATLEYDMDKGDPVQVVVEVDKDGKPTKYEDVKYVTFYEDEINKVKKEMVEQQKELDKKVAEHKQKTEIIVGIFDEKKNEKTKLGLQDQRNNEVDYLKACLDEQKYLQPLVNNSDAELRLLKKRNAALRIRLAELEKWASSR